MICFKEYNRPVLINKYHLSMEGIYNSLKELIKPQMLSKAADLIEEKKENVSSATSSIIASLLGVMLKKDNTPQIRNIFEEGGNLNILSNIEDIFDERHTENQQRIGDDFLQHLLGDKAADFTAPISGQHNISKVAVNRLVSMIAPVVAGFFGKKLVSDNWSMHKIFDALNKEKDYFGKYIPAGIINSFGLGSVIGTQKAVETEPKKKQGWIPWVVIILLLLLLFLLWRSCGRDSTETVTRETIVTDTVRTRTDNTETRRIVPEKVETTLALPDGAKLKAYRGGVEDRMIQFLQSDDYKNAKDADLKERWFQFDNIAFEFGSATELKSESKAQLDNIVAILKQYPNAKIKVAGFADKRGSEEVNMEISRERAKTIENILDKAGVGKQVVRTQGYGDEYAKHSANAPDSIRSEDRDIALRFVK